MQELGKNAFSFEILILSYIGHKKFCLSDYKLFAASMQRGVQWYAINTTVSLLVIDY